MKTFNIVPEQSIQYESEVDSILLTNKKGGFYYGNLNLPISKFNGLFFPYKLNKKNEWDVYRTLENIGIPLKVDSAEYDLSSVKILKQKSEENFFFNHSDSFIYEVKNYSGTIPFVLDCKKIYDGSTQGRIYKITKTKGCYVISYEKFKDDSLSELDYKFYLAIKTDFKIKLKENWVERNYEYDEKRGENPLSWVFHAFDLESKSNGKLIVSYSEKKSLAIKKACDIFSNTKYILSMKKKYADSLSKPPFKLSLENSVIYRNSIIGLDNLVSEVNGIKGIYAGLPWFFHYWSRDEAISVGALILEEHYEVAKEILMRWVTEKSFSRVSNRFPSAGLGSADSTGWIFYRLNNLIKILSEKNSVDKYFKKSELLFLLKDVLKRILEIEDTYMKNGLIYNHDLETWMDTGENVGDKRQGFRIEIQALHVAMYDFAILISEILEKDNEELIERKTEFIKNVKFSFYKDGIIYDGLGDSTARPNVFIAAYIAPDLFTKKEWVSCFDIILKELYLDKKGKGLISSISKKHYLFCENHTGKNNVSYHRGDSWYWLNGLTAIVLNRFGKSKYKNHVKSILESSKLGLFEIGAIGCLPEISSASKISSEGCVSQAWSYAMLIELMHELYG